MSTASNDLVAAEIAREQAHVDRVYAELAKAVERVALVHAEGMSRGQTDRPGTGDPRDEEMAGLYERDALVFSANRRRATLEFQHEGLVFGRLDLQHGNESGNGGEREREVRYIGRLGVRDDEYEPLVIDWRAPAAAPFYRATPVDPHGVIRRRVLRCRGEEVIGVEDDLMVLDAPDDVVVIGDGALMAALTRSRGQTMRDIVATIQQHQDEAIRAPSRGVTEITGGPGTGKTVVALHRAAYLLYADRRKFESGGVLVVGPSAAYTAYIERVLPSLGEDSVTLRSLGDVVGGMTATRLDSVAAGALKGALRIRRLLGALVREPIPDAPTLLRVFVGGQAIRIEAAELDAVRRQVLRHHQRNSSWEVAARALAEVAFEQHRHGEREEFVDRFVDSNDVEAFMRQWWRPLDPREVLLWLADADRVQRLGRGVLSASESQVLADSYAEALSTGQWSVADVALIDDLATRLGPIVELPSEERGFYQIDELDDASQYGVAALRVGRDGEEATPISVSSERVSHDPRDRLLAGRLEPADEYAHILVDEAQDLSPMQWRMVGRRGQWASWTVVGDAAQSSWPDPVEASKARDEAFGTAPRRVFHMTTNYRNAREIFHFAEQLIRRHVPDADIPTAVRETGIEPRELTVAASELVDAAVQQAVELTEAVNGAVAIIGAPGWHEALTGAVDALGPDLAGRVVVIDPLSSKGLEWDATVVADPDGIVAHTAGGARTLYVALTRAAHRMTVVTVK